MSDFKPKPGSFTAYMEAMREEKAKPRPASPITLLEILSQRSDPSLSISDLGAQSGMDAARFLKALSSLRDSGYIAIEGDALAGKARLTDSGANVVRLARPA